MKYKAIVFMLLTVPVIISGFNLRMHPTQNNTMSDWGSANIQKDHYRPSVPAQAMSRNRTWVLHNLIYSFASAGTGYINPSDKYSYFYNQDIQTRLDSIQVYWYDIDTYSWFYNYTRILDYDQTGEYITVEYFKNWNAYIPFIRIECSYDDQNRLTDMYQYNFNWDLMEYYLTQRINFEYGTNCLNQMMTIMPSSTRSYYERYTFDNDEYGRIMTAYGTAGPDSVNWGQLSLEEITYKPEDTSTGPEYISYLSHNALIDEDWEDGYYGKIETKNSFSGWNGIAWNDFYHNIYNYNVPGFLMEILTQYMNGTFQNVGRYGFGYDEYFNLTDRYAQDWDAVLQDWDYTNELLEYEWSQTTHTNDDAVIPPVNLSLSAYPNPFNEAVKISIESKGNAPVNVTVCNVRGQLVKAFDSVKSVSWDGRGDNNKPVSNGVYFIKATRDGQSASRKIIKLN
jgi:hypothetical protein